MGLIKDPETAATEEFWRELPGEIQASYWNVRGKNFDETQTLQLETATCGVSIVDLAGDVFQELYVAHGGEVLDAEQRAKLLETARKQMSRAADASRLAAAKQKKSEKEFAALCNSSMVFEADRDQRRRAKSNAVYRRRWAALITWVDSRSDEDCEAAAKCAFEARILRALSHHRDKPIDLSKHKQIAKAIGLDNEDEDQMKEIRKAVKRLRRKIAKIAKDNPLPPFT